MDAFLSDFRHAFRVFFKRPGLTLLAILALAVSLGMSTTAFSTLNGIFFKPLPFRDAEELHHIYVQNERVDMRTGIPFSQFGELEQLDSFDDVIGYSFGTINISGKGRPERYEGAFVSPNFLGFLGCEPVLGRGFSKATTEEDGPRELLISEKLWREKFRADPDILGMTVRANGAEHSIVGILPEGFHFPNKAMAWMPVNRAIFPGKDLETMQVMAIGRLSGDSTQSQAARELKTIFAGWDNRILEGKEDLTLTCEPYGRVPMNAVSNSVIIAAVGAVIFILLVSCANVANLLVGRALTRGREMAIRSALGATRKRIMRQLLTESLVLSFFGAIGGLLYAAWAVDATMQSPVYQLPYWINFELDWRVFLFVLLVMVFTALVSGLIPAWQASKTDLNEMLKDTSHTSTSFRLGRMTRFLAVIQIAFSCALLFGAGLITRNVYQMSGLEPGYPEDQILTMRMGLFPGDYPEEALRDAFFGELVERVKGIPAVESSAATSWIGEFGNYDQAVFVPHKDDESPEMVYAYVESVSPGYFETFGLNLLQGRHFNARDNTDAEPVAIVNEAFARLNFGRADPLGQEIKLFEGKAGQNEEPQLSSVRVIGVVPSVRVSNFTKPNKPEPIIYLPYTQSPSMFMSLVVRSDIAASGELQSAIEDEILALDPHLPVYFTKTMETFIGDQIYPYKVLANFFLAIGFMALFLAAIGVYGMLAFNVSRRRREIGIRMALGANSLRIVTQILRQGFVQVVLGLAVGTGLAFLVGQLTRNFLLGINPNDPSVYLGMFLVLIGVATLAFFLPARRAARLSPMEALRYE